MAIFQVESDTCHGRGFSRDDANGFLARLASFLMRPASDGASQNFTVNASNEQATCTTHGYSNGDPIIVTSTTTLPSPLAESTEYYVIYVDPNTFQFAATYGDAVDGTAINITDTGTGTHSVYAKGGGANWYVFADYSKGDDQNFATTDVNTSTEEITLTAHEIEAKSRVSFTSSGTLPAGISAGTVYYAYVVDANTIKIASSMNNFNSGTFVNITDAGSGTHTITPLEKSMIFTNTSSPSANDYNTGPDGGPPIFVRIAMYTQAAGTVGIQFIMWHDTTLHYSYGHWNGMIVSTYDDADFAYDIRAGDECCLFSTRLGTAWDSVGLDTFVGDSNLLEGTDKVGVVQSGLTAGSSVVIQLDTGEAANFTEDKWYFIYDYDGHTWVDYVQVTNVDTGTDQITVDAVYQDFPAGSVIGAYVHRWVSFGDGGVYGTTMSGYDNYISSASAFYWSTIPYISSTTTAQRFHYLQYGSFDYSDLPISLTYSTGYLSAMNPDDEGNQAVMRPGVYEYGGNRGYGVLKNTYVTRINSLANYLDGKTIGGSNYLFIQQQDYLFWGGSSSYAILFLDTESTS